MLPSRGGFVPGATGEVRLSYGLRGCKSLSSIAVASCHLRSGDLQSSCNSENGFLDILLVDACSSTNQYMTCT